MKQIDKEFKTIEEQVFNGIRKTINRFRENLFHYFTEADIHASLINDIKSGGSGIVIKRINNISVSLVHQEYLTNFRYKKDALLNGYLENEKITMLKQFENKQRHGDRGNFDLAVLNPEFVKSIITKKENIIIALDHIINKDNKNALSRMDNENFNEEL